MRERPPRAPHIAHLHLHATLDENQYADVLELLTGITPHVQDFPPDAVQLDLTSALRYFDSGPYELVQRAQLRLAGLYGIESSAGLAGNRMLAAMAAAASEPGRATRIPGEPADTAAWLRPRPVTALPGIGRATALTLSRYGLHTIGQVADLPPATLQRLLGAAPARLLAERARGHDPRPVTPRTPAARMTADLVLDRDCLDPAEHHRAVLGLAEELGRRLRTEGQATGRLTLTVRYADRTATTRTRTLPEATGHSPALATTALGLLTALGLQRARVRAYAIRADDLRPAAETHRQLTLDPTDHRARAAESAADRARHRFGPKAIIPAATASPTHRPTPPTPS
ncbi:ImpB/MucB/SamB family protein [Streptomyces sp. NBC_01190]|uniref:DNA polymerase Y family protein n=1 Tax=Streptomyces sp. NBC_01190 TaxID=2903767 RepID=UPI00386648C9|nr:ImpB/MucB/SamB family protein [Streptomyces sp. NBC_01190]